MVFNATFNNISVISWWSVLLVEENVVPGENQRPFASHRQTLSLNVESSIPCPSGFRTHNLSGDIDLGKLKLKKRNQQTNKTLYH